MFYNRKVQSELEERDKWLGVMNIKRGQSANCVIKGKKLQDWNGLFQKLKVPPTEDVLVKILGIPRLEFYL